MSDPVDAIIAELRAVQELFTMIAIADVREQKILARYNGGPRGDFTPQEKTRIAVGKHLIRLEQAAIMCYGCQAKDRTEK